MKIDGKEYKFNLPELSVNMKEIVGNDKKLEKIFSAFDNGDKYLSTHELKNVFNIFQDMDVKDKNNKSDNILTDDEIQKAINENEILKDFSVSEVKSFIKAVVKANDKNINSLKTVAKDIATDIYNQISGPSLNTKTIKQLQRIEFYNAYYILTEYEKMANEPLVQALGEEWNFSVSNIKHYVLKPLVSQAINLGIEVTHDYYKGENDVKKLNSFAKTLCDAIGNTIKNYKFGSSKTSQKTKIQPINQPKKTQKKEPPLNNEKPADIAKQLYDQISGPSMNKNTIAILKKIGKNNAAQVVSEYKKIAVESIANAIDEEWGLDEKTIKEYICKPLIEQAKSKDMYCADSAEEEYQQITSMESINKFIEKWSSEILEVTNYRKDVPDKINFKDFTIDALKKKYPDKECRQMGNIILIKNKDGSMFMELDKDDEGKLKIYDKYDKNNEYTRVRCYNTDGTLDYFSVDGVWKGYRGLDWNKRQQTRVDNTVNELIEDIYYKIGGVVPGTRKSLGENIKLINADNILEVLALYQAKTGESLYDAINNEIGLGDTRKAYIEHLNDTLDRAFSRLAEGNIIQSINEFQIKTNLSMLDSISKNSGMPRDKKQAFMDKINTQLQKFVKGINADNIEETLKKYQESSISITEIIAKHAGLPKSIKDSYLNHINQAISKHINNLEMWEYMYDRVKTDYDDIETPTLNAMIAKEKGLNPNTRVNLIRQLENRIMNDYISPETKKDDIKTLIEKELTKLSKNPDNMDVEFLDRLNSKLYSRDSYYFGGEEQEGLKAPNGKIDNFTYQGNSGDCWLLAAINAISRSPKGLKILNNSLKLNPDGSVTVRLNGVNKSYTISRKDLYAAREFATGDLDVRAIEIAVERYLMETKRDDINGGWSGDAFDILLGGNKKSWKWLGTKLEDTYKEKINNPNILVTASISNADDESKVKASNGEEIHSNHAYTVVKADDKYVYLINPWDSSKLLKLSYAEFKKIFDQFQDIEI